jgi:biotin carboxyl carrier protein
MTRRILIDGQPVTPAKADIIEVEPSVYSILIDGVSFEARISADEISIDGHRFRFEIEDPRRWSRSFGGAALQGRATIVAPMPGKVVRVLVRPGDAVIKGQGIIVVEAMKMQNELKSPRDGTVTAIEVKEHDSVNAGAVLAVIE